MLGSTRVRVVSGVAVLVATSLAYQWWVSPEREIRRTIRVAVAAVTHTEPDTDLRAIAAVAALQTSLAPDITVDLGVPSAPALNGRQEVVAMAARLRTSTPMLRIQVFDESIVVAQAEATVRLTAQVTTRDRSGEELADAHHMILRLLKDDGRWLVSSVIVVRPSTESL
jgi:SnoaL-like domain